MPGLSRTADTEGTVTVREVGQPESGTRVKMTKHDSEDGRPDRTDRSVVVSPSRTVHHDNAVPRVITEKDVVDEDADHSPP